MKNKKNRFISFGIILILFLLSLIGTAGIQERPKKMTYEQAYKEAEPRVLKSLPSIRSWLDDEHFLLLREEEKKSSKLYKINAKTGKMSLFLDYDQIKKNLPGRLLPSRHAAHTKDYSSLIYSHQKDLYQYSVKQNQLQRLTAAAGEEKNPSFSPDEKYLAYTRNHNLYVLDLKSRLEHQLTSDGSDTIYNGWSSWVYYEEILGRRTRFRAFWWSPDSRRIAFLRFDDSPVPTFPLFRAKGAHGELEIERYPKSGDPNPKVRLGLVTIPEGKITWADVDEDADHYVAWPFWLADSSQLTFQWMNRDQNHIKIYIIDLETGKKKEIFAEKQASWVEFFEDLHFFKDGSGFLLRSDVDGWSHLYYYDLEGKSKKRLTQGEWSVTGISLVDEKNKKVYFTARRDQTTETHLFQVKLDGTGFNRLTEKPGTHRILVSPGGDYYLDHYSNVDTPSQQDLYQSDGTFLRNIDQSQTPLWNEYVLGKKELFTIPTEDGWMLPAYWILPPDFDESKKYPVLFNIYGGPGASTVRNSYPYLSQLYLAQEGIIIFSVDHRSSGHYGKKGVSLMHRNLGKWEMHDLMEAVRWLHQKPFVDKERIGISGGSYGGYTTCMALTYGADYFTHGYARASVTDWRLYDTVYTERYMDRPCENKPGYEFGSVMNHAEKLKGVLFLAHGTMDDNVHMQNTVQLIDKFIDLGKKFEFMLYPNQRHGFRDKKREHSNRHYVDFWFKHFLNR
ncbi:MAG: prolyl oligopeptidase family serine peptidase [Candidatus Aminicenantes bacterium]|nr:prolyl oligopeptidase family serine peptidase [Candidatus Aminicenantes bacterium]